MTFVELPDGLDFALRPVKAGLCRYESLKDGTLDICDLALMNDTLNVFDENERRIDAADKDK